MKLISWNVPKSDRYHRDNPAQLNGSTPDELEKLLLLLDEKEEMEDELDDENELDEEHVVLSPACMVLDRTHPPVATTPCTAPVSVSGKFPVWSFPRLFGLSKSQPPIQPVCKLGGKSLEARPSPLFHSEDTSFVPSVRCQ